MAPRKKSVPNVNAEYNDLMRTAHQENRNGNPYNNSYTFTARGSQKVASKARKFIKAALLVGGAAGLAYFFRGQIGKHTTPILKSLEKKYTNLTLKPRAKYATHKTRILKNANSTTPGFAGRTVQGWRSTRNGAASTYGKATRGAVSTYGKARNGIGKAYGKARNGIGEAYGKARNGIGEAYGVVRGLTTRPRTVSAAPRRAPPSLESKETAFDNALRNLVGHKLYAKSVANARTSFPYAPAGRTTLAEFNNELGETLLKKYRTTY